MMMEIVAASDLIRPKPTYHPPLLSTRFTSPQISPTKIGLSPPSPGGGATSPHKPNGTLITTQNNHKLPTVSIALSQHPALIYSPKNMVGGTNGGRNPSPPQSSPSSTTTPTTPHPTTPFQPTPTRPTPKKIYTCKLCGKTFNNSGNFSRHQKVHTGEKPYRCEICGKAFTQSSTLKRHILSHSGDRSYKCQVCSKGYVDPWSLKKHMKNHGFNSYSHVQVKPILPHYKYHPPNIVVPQKHHMLPWCNKPDLTPPGLYLPITTEQCPLSSFKSGGSAFTQVESKISREKKDFDCKENNNITQFGSATFKSVSHDKDATNEGYTCEKCNRSFTNINSYKTHQLMHTGALACNGELSCHQCKAVFLTKQQLQAHMSSHTSSFWCVYCERSFRNEYNFKQHQTVHTTLLQENDKKYPAWLENFKQEMMSRVSLNGKPQSLPMPPLNTPASIHFQNVPPDTDLLNEKNREDIKALKLKAMMELDPLSQAVKFNGGAIPTTPTSLYALTTAGLAYSTNTESTDTTTPFSPFALPHPKPIKPDIKVHPTLNEGVRKTPPTETSAFNTCDVTVKMEPEGEPGASGSGGSSGSTQEHTMASPGTVEAAAAEETTAVKRSEQEHAGDDEGDESRPEGGEDMEVEGEPARKKLRKISYHCCICNYTNFHLSELTSHLENEHNLSEYDLIKNLLACLGDIGS